jgi:murein DD-endopeptidase MepM/ murein hydrolase activator NlpD
VGLGQGVGQGTTIGAVGCTGWCTGPHLHFEVHIGGRAVDPLGYLP